MAKLKSKSIKKDTYFGSRKKYLLRIRDKNGRGILNLKSKNVEKGIEVNQEVEIPIKSIDRFKALMKDLKIPAYMSKKKISEVYIKGDFQIELNEITGLGHYLEIEYKVRDKSGIPKAKNELNRIFKQFGFNPSQYEKRYYIDLLAKKRKNKNSN